MARIRSLIPNVSREEAVAQLSDGGVVAWARNTVSGPLRSVADFYIPFCLFRVEITNRGVTQTELFGLEVVRGTMDLFRFENVPETVVVETRNVVDSRLDEAHAAQILIEKVRRLIYVRGFFKMKDLRLEATQLPGELHVPYWIGFRGHGKSASLSVMDAVRRRREGGKVRQIVVNWLLSSGSNRISPP